MPVVMTPPITPAVTSAKTSAQKPQALPVQPIIVQSPAPQITIQNNIPEQKTDPAITAAFLDMAKRSSVSVPTPAPIVLPAPQVTTQNVDLTPFLEEQQKSNLILAGILQSEKNKTKLQTLDTIFNGISAGANVVTAVNSGKIARNTRAMSETLGNMGKPAQNVSILNTIGDITNTAAGATANALGGNATGATATANPVNTANGGNATGATASAAGGNGGVASATGGQGGAGGGGGSANSNSNSNANSNSNSNSNSSAKAINTNININDNANVNSNDNNNTNTDTNNNVNDNNNTNSNNNANNNSNTLNAAP